MLINRHRFSEIVAERLHNHVPDGDQGEAEIEAMRAAHASALQIISSHLHIAAKGLMTYCEWLGERGEVRIGADFYTFRRRRTRYTPAYRGRPDARCDAA